MTRLNIKQVELKNLEDRLRQELNSELPIKDKKFKTFLHNMIKGYYSIKGKYTQSVEEAQKGIIRAQSDINFLTNHGESIEYNEFGYTVGQLIKFSVLYERLSNE